MRACINRQHGPQQLVARFADALLPLLHVVDDA
jgi:hypothetical protein